jgi:hypothetical protein
VNFRRTGREKGIFLQGWRFSILPRMSLPRFLVFTPVPLRARCDGWDASLQLRFVQLLAAGAKPGEAARALGKNRQNAYALRRRAGAESFAAAWDAAAAEGQRVRAASSRKAPKRVRAWVPSGPRAEAMVARGEHEIANARSPDEARAALSRMLDGLYPQTNAKNDKSDKFSTRSASPGNPKISSPTAQTVAFRAGPLRRPPC